MSNNNFFLFEENSKSKKLVVVFSGVNAKSFMGYKLIKNIKCNKLFIRDPHKSWYHGKIDNVSNNINELTSKIEKICKNFNKSDIIFIGSSMGAYASLLIGTKLNIGKIIAFGPQIFINKNLPNSPKEDSNISNKNLTALINSSKSNIEILIGLNELVDLYHVKDIDNPNVIIYKLYAQAHNVMFFLNKIEILYPFISSRILDYDYSIKTLNYKKISTDKELLKNAVELFFIHKNYDKAKDIFKKLYIKNPDLHIFIKYYALCFYHLKNITLAIELLNKAKYIVYMDEELHYFLGLSYLKLKKFEDAKKSFENSIEFAIEKKLKYYIKLSISLRGLKAYENALHILKKSLLINSKNYGTYYQLAQVYKEQNNFHLAKESLIKAKALNPDNQKILSELQLIETMV